MNIYQKSLNWDFKCVKKLYIETPESIQQIEGLTKELAITKTLYFLILLIITSANSYLYGYL